MTLHYIGGFTKNWVHVDAMTWAKSDKNLQAAIEGFRYVIRNNPLAWISA